MATAKTRRVAAASAAVDKRSLTVRDRQFMHAVRGVTDAVESAKPGTIHSVEIVMGRNKVFGKIVYNRDREVGDVAETVQSPDEGPGLGRSRRNKPSERERKTNKVDALADDASQERGGHIPRVASTKAAADVSMPAADADEAARKLAAMQLRDAITAETTAVVRKLGGDAETGGQYLDPPQPLQLFGNKLRNIRLPKDSKAADMMPEEFCAEIERMYQDAVARGNTPAVANAALESLRSALRPRDADEAPVPSPARARAVSDEQTGMAALTPPQTQSLPGPSGSDSLSAARQPDQQRAGIGSFIGSC